MKSQIGLRLDGRRLWFYVRYAEALVILGFVHGAFDGCGSTAGTIEFSSSSPETRNGMRCDIQAPVARWEAAIDVDRSSRAVRLCAWRFVLSMMLASPDYTGSCNESIASRFPNVVFSIFPHSVQFIPF